MRARRQAETGSREPGPSGPGPSGFDPARWSGPRYSPNLNRWLVKQARRRGGLWGPPSVYHDAKAHRWIGILDPDGWFYGTRLPRCLTVGSKAEVFAHPPKSLVLIGEPDFWTHYARIGRCHIDPEHNGWWASESERWQTDGDTRHCLWCEDHTQHLQRWSEVVQRERWEDAIATEARRAETENTGSVHEGAGPQGHRPHSPSSSAQDPIMTQMLKGCPAWTLTDGDCGECAYCTTKAAREDAKEVVERNLSSLREAPWVAEMRSHFTEHGFYRTEDLDRLLGKPSQSVRIGSDGKAVLRG